MTFLYFFPDNEYIILFEKNKHQSQSKNFYTNYYDQMTVVTIIFLFQMLRLGGDKKIGVEMGN